MPLPHYQQHDAMDCGPTSLRMIAKHYGKSYSLEFLREKCYLTHEGVSLLGISHAAELIGFRTRGVKLTLDDLIEDAPLPAIVHWKQNHFVVVYKVKKNTIWVSDPSYGLVKYQRAEFEKYWCSDEDLEHKYGVALLLEPAPNFYELDDGLTDKASLKFIFNYLKPYYKLITQIFVAMALGSLLQLIFPFLTQSIVDVGIENGNLNFIYIILAAQVSLTVGRTMVDFIRSWIMLHISTRINIAIISDFLIKLMKLPIGFFDAKMVGDLLQRIGDHQRIEHFLTSSSLEILFAVINLVIFGAVLAFYDFKILLIFLLGSAIYVSWIMLFMKKRRDLDFKRFHEMSANQNNLIQIINGMQEIKLNNCEKSKRWGWENIQARLFNLSVKGLSLNQYQNAGALLINETKNILITFYSAASVINGDITLGMMMSIQYMVGQLNGPIMQLINFIDSAQDAKISLERLSEIHNKKDEEGEQNVINELPTKLEIKIENLSFQYDPLSEFVLKDINLAILENKTTAIVGASGSGKTTLLKLLLGFYPVTKGGIKIGDIALENYQSSFWRQKCGVVMQEGFIFSDTIASNISVSDEQIDKKKLDNAVRMANIVDLIESLPLGLNTKIGADGHGLSQGQKQRILIARAIYKSPEFIFFDEATNALDANNEKIIMENLNTFFTGRTAVVVAHRLSTVKNADQIIVLEKGEIIERGTHSELTALKGAYYNLVKNQLELGN